MDDLHLPHLQRAPRLPRSRAEAGLTRRWTPIAALALLVAAGAPACTDDAEPAVASLAFVAELDVLAGQLPEGVAVSNDGQTAYVGMILTGEVLAVSLDGGQVSAFGHVPAPPPNLGFVLGLVTGPAGDVYVGVASFDPTTYAPGVYRVAPGGGAGQLFAHHAGLQVPNGLARWGDDALLVTDTLSGSLFKVDLASGDVSLWTSSPLLQGPVDAPCAAIDAFPAGANGLTIRGSDVFVANFNNASLVRVPILADGAAGTPVQVAIDADCDTLGGLDGVVADVDGRVYGVGNAANTLVRVDADGTVDVLARGGLLDSPASVAIVTRGGRRHLLLTNNAAASAQTPGGSPRPGLLIYGPLP